MFVVPGASVTTAFSTLLRLRWPVWWSMTHHAPDPSETITGRLWMSHQHFIYLPMLRKLSKHSCCCQKFVGNGILQRLRRWKCFAGEDSHRTSCPLTNNPSFSTNYHSAVTRIFYSFFANSLYQDSKVRKPQWTVRKVWGWMSAKTKIFWIVSDFRRGLDSRLSQKLRSECRDPSAQDPRL